MHGEEGIRIAEDAEHHESLMRVCFGLGQLYLRKGDVPLALTLLERSLTLCRQQEVRLWFPLIASHLGYAYALSGRFDAALALLEQATQQAASEGRMAYQTLQLAYLSEAYLLAGRPAEATEQARRALDLSHVLKGRGDQAWILRLLGELAARQQPADIEPAEASYQQARTLANALGMRPLQAHCHHGLGALYAQTGRRDLAHTELAAAIALYRTLDMVRWVPQAESALAGIDRS